MERRPARSDREDTSRDRSSRDREEPRRGGRDSERSSRDSERGGRGREREAAGAARRSFSYQARSAEEVNKRANQGGKDFDVYVRNDIKTFSPNNGPNEIRILPPTWPDPKHYGIDIWVHYGVGPDSQSYLCLHKMKGEDCPICDELTRARRDREDEDYIKNLEPTKRVLFYLVDRANEQDGVQAWASPWTIDRDITKISVDRKTGDVLPIDDPDDGYDVEFDRTGKGVGTKYVGLAIARRSSSLGKDAWLDFAVDNPITEILEYYSYDHIQKAFGGGPATSRGREESTSRDSDRSRDSGGGKDREREGRDRGGRESRREEKVEHTWESVHKLEGAELDKLIEDERLDLNPDKFDSDEELADAICEDLRIDKPREGREERGGGGRLAEMRQRRGG